MSLVEKELPNGWTMAKIHQIVSYPKQDIVDGPFGSNLKASEYVNEGIPIIRLQNVERNEFVNKNIKFVTKEKANQLKRHSFVSNDIVITKLGIPVGKACIVPNFLPNGIIVADILRIHLNQKQISIKFLMYLINSQKIISQFASQTRGTTRPRVNLTKFRDFVFPLPPLNEQKKIVAKIEELFSLVDSAKDTLEKTLVLLKQYRQSILKHAFEGKLVPQDPNDEPSSVLLEKIKKENPDKKFSDIAMEKQLPKGWIWISLFETISKIKRGPSLKCNRDGKGIRYITSGNLREGKLVLELDYKFLSGFDKIEQCKLNNNDLILNCVNSIEMIGKSAVFYKKYGDAIVGFNNYGLELKNFLNPEFANYFFQSSIAKNQIYFLIKRAVNQVSFATNELKRINVSLPPLNEQKRIVAKIEESFSLIEKNEILIEQLLLQYSKIKNSILKQAFEGKLVPQDPNDEPAEVLLQRIREEKNGK